MQIYRQFIRSRGKNNVNNRKIYIEIQNTRETDYLESLLYCTSKIIVDHQKLGDNFSNISKVISISIMYFNLGLGDDYIYYGTNEFYGLNTHNKLVVKKRVELLESIEPKYKFEEKKIFPEYYIITVERYKNIIQRRIDEWVYMFKNDEVAEGSTSKNIDKAEQKLAELNMSEKEKALYDKYLINLARDRDAINTAKEEGHDEGKIEGKIEGKTEGIELMILNSYNAGISIELLSKIAQLSEEEVKIILKRNPL